MFNSAEYSWSDIKVVLLGRTIGGLKGIKYKKSQEKEVIHGAGSEPRAVQRGNKTYEGEITIYQSELEALNAAAGDGKDLLDLRNVNIVVAYAPEQGLPLVTNTVKGVEFTEYEKGMAQGDKFSEHTLPFVALGLE